MSSTTGKKHARSPASPRSPVKKQKTSEAHNGNGHHADADMTVKSESSQCPQYQTGAVCHIDIPVKDMKRAKDFYGAVFGWEFKDFMPTYSLWTAPVKSISGGLDSTVSPSSNSGVVLHICSSDVPADLKKVHEHGGVVLKSCFLIAPGVGVNCFFMDTEGNKMGLWSKKEGEVVETKTLKQKIHFPTISPHDAYENIMDEKRASDLSGGSCQVSRDVFGSFNLQNWVTGRNIMLEPDRKIVQSWRGASFPEGHFTTVTFELESDGSAGCYVNLTQEQVPVSQYDMLCKGWYEHTWNKWGEGDKQQS